MDRNSLLQFDSFYPRHIGLKLPYGQFPCLKRNSTAQQDFITPSATLENKLTKRGSPQPVINNAKNRVITKDKSSLFPNKTKYVA